MKDFVYGLRNDGYIYGRLFIASDNNGQFVIDIGEKEFNVEGFDVEVWNGERYIPTTANKSILDTKFYGGYTRLKQQTII